MRWHVLAVMLVGIIALAAGCQAGQEPYPPRPGSGTPGGGTPGGGTERDSGPGPDGGIYSDAYYGDAGNRLLGRVCRVLDLRYPTDCTQYADMSGIEVAIRGSTATTTTLANGGFAIDVSGLQTVVLEVGRGSSYYEPSIIHLDLSAGLPSYVPVPLVDASAWEDLLVELDTQPPDGTGTVAVYVSDQDEPLSYAQISNISAAAGIYYDDGGAQRWALDGSTGAAGAALVFGVNEPTAELTVTDTTGDRYHVVGDIPVVADAISFISVDMYYY